ncbi:hypothetical protein AALP_AA5G162800 [Arabis alpina]|uniref:Uncharacterized protein n=1 Tax=Arabis alpina TaxID=50452 RepID=A0A087GXG8_ARAAL|nr:hypothetical protein AALP_AA5G162800 [Arabis alpina]
MKHLFSLPPTIGIAFHRRISIFSDVLFITFLGYDCISVADPFFYHHRDLLDGETIPTGTKTRELQKRRKQNEAKTRRTDLLQISPRIPNRTIFNPDIDTSPKPPKVQIWEAKIYANRKRASCKRWKRIHHKE